MGGRGILTLNVDQPQTKQKREREKKQKKTKPGGIVYLLFVCVLCVYNSVRGEKKKSHPGEKLNDIFNGTEWPTLGNVLFLLQYLLKIKISIFICEETKIYNNTEYIKNDY